MNYALKCIIGLYEAGTGFNFVTTCCTLPWVSECLPDKDEMEDVITAIKTQVGDSGKYGQEHINSINIASIMNIQVWGYEDSDTAHTFPKAWPLPDRKKPNLDNNYIP